MSLPPPSLSVSRDPSGNSPLTPPRSLAEASRQTSLRKGSSPSTSPKGRVFFEEHQQHGATPEPAPPPPPPPPPPPQADDPPLTSPKLHADGRRGSMERRRTARQSKNRDSLREALKQETEDRTSEWTPEAGLPGMDFVEGEVDPVGDFRLWEVLQSLDRTSEELLESKVTNEELMQFLEMGEKRVVDLAVKVRLLEDQNEKLAAKSVGQENEITTLRRDLAESVAREKAVGDVLRVTQEELEEQRENVAKFQAQLHNLGSERTRENEMYSERVRETQILLEQVRREKDKQAADLRLAQQSYDRERKRLQDRLEDWHKKADQHLNKSKQLEKELKDKARELEKLHAENASLHRTFRHEKQRSENELNAVRMKLQEETVRLNSLDKELNERQEKTRKNEEKLEKEKENIKAALTDAVREIQEQREAEHQLLLEMKLQYEKELDAQFDSKQQELEEHWRQKESLEMEQLEGRRNSLESELQMKMQKAAENRQRLEKYSQNLERYGKRLKVEYDNWQREKSQVYTVLDEAHREREDVERTLNERIATGEAKLKEATDELHAKEQKIGELEGRITDLEEEKGRLLVETKRLREKGVESEQKINELMGETERLIEDNSTLEKHLNELKLEHDQLLEEMTYMRSREEEERELRRKTNEMLLASYKYKRPQSNVVVNAIPGRTDKDGIDLLCWKCHQQQMEEEGSGLLSRTREARRQMRLLTLERQKLQSDREMFLKAHKLDAEKTADEAGTLKEERKKLKEETELLAAERKARAALLAVYPKLSSSSPPPEHEEAWVDLPVDPDHNPAYEMVIEPGDQLEASRRRKRDLVYLKSIYSTGGGSPRRDSHSTPVRGAPAAAPATVPRGLPAQ